MPCPEYLDSSLQLEIRDRLPCASAIRKLPIRFHRENTMQTKQHPRHEYEDAVSFIWLPGGTAITHISLAMTRVL
jgi:hypothetical protein